MVNESCKPPPLNTKSTCAGGRGMSVKRTGRLDFIGEAAKIKIWSAARRVLAEQLAAEIAARFILKLHQPQHGAAPP